MTSADLDQTARLMKEGLDHYALGDAGRAIACWRQVLELDPEHADARDYLRAAEADCDEAPPAPAPAAAPLALEEGLLSEAVTLLRSGQLQEAVDLLVSVVRDDPEALDAHAYLDLARAQLVQVYRDRVGPGDQPLRVRVSAEEVMKYNLPARAGFLLSRIDSGTSVDELLAVSGMDPFDALGALAGLLDAGIVEAAA